LAWFSSQCVGSLADVSTQGGLDFPVQMSSATISIRTGAGGPCAIKVAVALAIPFPLCFSMGLTDDAWISSSYLPMKGTQKILPSMEKTERMKYSEIVNLSGLVRQQLDR